MGGTGDKIKGKAKELKGVATNDRSAEFKGKAKQAKGGIRDKAEEKDRELKEEQGGDQPR